MVGSILVLMTWILAVCAIAVLGAPAALLASSGRCSAGTLRMSLWWGLLVATVVILWASVWLPLRSAGAAWLMVALVAGLGACAWWLLRRSGARRCSLSRSLALRARWWLVPILVVIGLALAYLAIAATGPVTNYDSGLYHLGAIKYAGDYATIPGLAHLYFPFGYNNSLFPLAAILGNGPWEGIGYRLVNGLLMSLMAADLVIRLLQRRYSAGTWVLLVGFAAAWIPLIAFSDYWVVSPTSDSAVLVLTIVAVSYLSDALSNPRGWRANGAASLAIALVIVSMRPTMVFFALTAAIVLAVRGVRLVGDSSDGRGRALAPWILAGVLGVVLAGAQTLRDYLLSGWLQYPLSILPFDVDWRAPDPVGVRTATLGAARDPNDLWNAAAGYSWIPEWAARLPSQWETYEFLVLAICATAAVIAASRLAGRLPYRTIGLAIAPSLVTCLVWFVASPPSFRFIWGPLFSLAVVPLGWSLHRIATAPALGPRIRGRAEPAVAIAVAGALGLLLVYCTVARLDTASMTETRHFTLGPIAIPYSVTPIHPKKGVDVALPSGLVIQTPAESDQCWDVFPLCAGQLPQAFELRGSSIADGFRG